ncbi:alpha/beta fold hydrolase [Microbacterium karelineae]|uniref:alpha/beta fold hydrolase n=1 Tax=Microbacterium karelineae TaxID=2654283 RepID=UPI0012E9B8CF|nr:alpha/beta hydrolase [Microbacterium karelineae]
MDPQVVLVHGIRTSATMWRAQLAHLARRGIRAEAVDLPGHGTRLGEPWSLDEAIGSIDRAVARAAERGPVVLVGHSLGGLLSTAYVGRAGAAPPVAAFVGACCTAFPRGAGLTAYRLMARGVLRLPGQGRWFIRRALDAQLPPETRADLEAGGYALGAEDGVLASLAELTLARCLVRIQARTPPVWFVNGEWDQLRVNERTFTRLVPRAELIVVPRTTHLLTAMRPRVANALIDLAVASVARSGIPGPTW